MTGERRLYSRNDNRSHNHRSGKAGLRCRRAFLAAFSVSAFLCLTITVGGFTARAQEDGEIYYKYYTSVRIRSEDTLWTLADTYCDDNFRSRGAFIKEVARINHLLDEQITEGDCLIVPYYSTEFR